MEQLKNLLNVARQLFTKQRTALEGTVLDRNLPDPRPPNKMRDRFSVIDVAKTIIDKESALKQIRMSTAATISEYKYLGSLHYQLITMAEKKAVEFGATEEEISKAKQLGQVDGDHLNAGMEW